MKPSIIVLPKENKDRTNADSNHPICWLNFHFNFFTKPLVTHLNRIIHNYIHLDQTGFIPNRSLTDNIQKPIQLITHCRKEKIPAVLASIDTHKAFNSMEFIHLQAIMISKNFGEDFLHAIETIYTKPKAYIKINDCYFTEFILSWGKRQGSPLLFDLAMEPLAEAIQAHPTNQGLRLNQGEFKLVLYVDNLILYLTSPIESLTSIQDLLGQFSVVKGLLSITIKLNYTRYI